MHWMVLPLKRYAQFKGRSRRKEFWMWALFIIVATLALSFLDSVLGLGGRTVIGRPAGATVGAGFHTSGGVLTGLFALAMFVPNLAVQVRRLHDTDRSGWWLLLPVGLYLAGVLVLLAGVASAGTSVTLAGAVLSFAGLIAAVVLFVFFCLDGTPGFNRFGADPKDPAGAVDLGDVFA
ncbi:DUF805 domain-containing protein [Sphingomonas sp.]|uniref:DUF805 domain-containing protein n=1 Tax=Sphingomonas sp. TaxID=28214 RepID=UPI0035BC3A06